MLEEKLCCVIRKTLEDSRNELTLTISSIVRDLRKCSFELNTQRNRCIDEAAKELLLFAASRGQTTKFTRHIEQLTAEKVDLLLPYDGEIRNRTAK